MTRQKTERYSAKEKERSSCFLNPLFVILPVVFVLFYNIVNAEDMTITTYYPSPNGTYDALSVKRLSVGDTNADGSINASDVSATSGYLLVADKLGIGTTTPQTKLQINAVDEDYTFPNPGSTARGALFIRSTTSDKETGITFSSANSNNAQAGIYVHQDSAAGTHMYLATTDIYATGPQTRMTILNNGNVGIGTVSPTSKLHIYDTTNMPAVPDINSQVPFKVTDGTVGILIDANQIESVGGDLYLNHRATGGTGKHVIVAYGGGSLGVGTSAPNGKAEVYYPLNTSGLFLTSPGYDSDSLNAGLRFHSASDSGQQGDIVFYHRGSGDPGLDIWGYPSNSSPSCCIFIAHFSNNGNVGIGTAAPSQKLDIAGGDMILHSDSSIGVLRVGGANTSSSGRLDIAARDGDVMFRMWTDSAIAQVNSAEGGSWTSTSFDLAEKINYENETGIEPGDIIVSTGKKGAESYADKSSYPYQETIIGIVSTQPAFVGGVPWEENPSKSPVTDKALSLAGRVPAKVCTENGTIKVGDYLTSSSIPGVAMKATKPGQVVGKAMEEYKEKNPKKVGKITVFVNPVWFGADLEQTTTSLEKKVRDLESEVAELKQEIQELRNSRK